MSVIYIVLPLALLFAGVAVGGFIWAVRQGQMDDLQTPAARILLDDDQPTRRASPRPGDETASHERAKSGFGNTHDPHRR